MVWVYDAVGRRRPMRRLTFGGEESISRVVRPTRRGIAFSSDREGDAAIFLAARGRNGNAPSGCTKPDAGTSHVARGLVAGRQVAVSSVRQGRRTSRCGTLSLADKQATPPFGAREVEAPATNAVDLSGRTMGRLSVHRDGILQLFAQPIPPNGTKYQITEDVVEQSPSMQLVARRQETVTSGSAAQFAEVRIATSPTLALQQPDVAARRGIFAGKRHRLDQEL